MIIHNVTKILRIFRCLSTKNINLEEADTTNIVVDVMRPDEHSYANYDADHYFDNSTVPVGEYLPQN